MKKNVRISEHLVNITAGDQFAILSRTPKDDKYSITMSIPVTPRMVDLLHNSGIVYVTSFTADGTIVFKRQPFYETHLMIDIITDLLERHIIDAKHENHFQLL